ncbi:hypothetical protein Bbelb_035570 [Branchiostoma belcheri]|nr:hypothetical protein Bbelb_035570 [Branchiostoma belcheri]
MDAEPVAIVIDGIPSSRGQSSVQHDQGLSGGKKREGEPNPGQQDAKKPRLDNGASPAFVHKTVATVAGLSGDYRPVGCQLIAYQTQGVDSSISQSAIHFRNVPARTNVTRAVGSNTTWAAQPQQLLGNEELRKMVEEKVAHCTAKANSQMKQLQDRVAKLTKVFKGWEEYAWKFQQQQQPTAQVLSSQRSGGSTSAPNPAADNSAPMHSPVVLQPNTTAPEPPAQKQPALVGLYNCVLQYKPRESGLFNRKSSQLAGRCDLTDVRSRGGEGGTPAPDGTETGTHAIFNAFGHVQIALLSKLPKKATQETEVTAAASRQQVVPKPPVPTYNQPPFVQRVSMATEAVGPQTSMQPTNPNVTIVQPPTQARRNTVKDLIGAQRAGPPQPQVATAPKPPPPQPVAQQQVGSGQRATPTGVPNPPHNIPTLVHHLQTPPPVRTYHRPSTTTRNSSVSSQHQYRQPLQAPPTRQKPPEKARVPSQDTANVNAVIDLTEDAEETTNSQALGRKPSGAGPPPLLKAVVEPSPPPNTDPRLNVNTSRNIFEVLQAIMNSARTIQAPPNFRTVTTSVQQVGQSLHTLPSTAPTYRRPPLQVQKPSSSPFLAY